MGRLLAALRNLVGCSAASTAIIFAISLIPVVLVAGAAVDYSNANRQRSRVQVALDAAVLAGVTAARDSLTAGNSQATAFAAAQAKAQSVFSANLGSSPAATASISVSQNGIYVSGSGSASAAVDTSVLAAVGFRQMPISASAAAQTTFQKYLDVYLLVDISASMLLPATTEGINAMVNGKPACALACHDNANVCGAGCDSYQWARNNNIQLRYQVVNTGVQALLDYISSQPDLAATTRVGLWSFDAQLNKNAGLTTTYSTISRNFPQPALATDEAAAATAFDNLIGSFVSLVGKAGDGSSSDNPRKMVIIASDGVNDPTRAWKTDTSLRPLVRVFNTGFCTTMKNNGVIVAIINTPYYPMPWDWGYMATLAQPGSLGGATRVDDIPIALSQCAGDFFMVAPDVSAITQSFTNLFKLTIKTKLTH
jgi:Flp pilus assembly protein TadG